MNSNIEPHDGRPYYADKSSNRFDYIRFENYIYPIILKLYEKYPNDQEFGEHVRVLLRKFKHKENTNFPGPINL